MRIRIKNTNLRRERLLFLSYVISVIIAIVVYNTGGTTKVYANLMYIPIAVVASACGKKQGVVHAAISALLIGPFMPLNVELNISQPSINWILRLIIYVTIAFVIGFFSDYNRQEFEKSRKKDKEIFEAQMATIYSLVKLSESRDHDTGAHVERVAVFCELLARHLQSIPKYKDYINEDYISNLSKASPLHDIGKVGIPDEILLKPGKLSEEEFEIMKNHTTIGANTLKEVKKRYPDNKFLELGINITLFHHERWDGTGYPHGISKEEIPLSARIMAIADAYEALRSKRVYKDAYTHEESLEIIKQGAGTFFDPEMVDILIQNQAEFKEAFEKYNS
jgi:response regulator RpfG family c-di-GMP phosphodiesterase